MIENNTLASKSTGPSKQRGKEFTKLTKEMSASYFQLRSLCLQNLKRVQGKECNLCQDATLLRQRTYLMMTRQSIMRDLLHRHGLARP